MDKLIKELCEIGILVQLFTLDNFYDDDICILNSSTNKLVFLDVEKNLDSEVIKMLDHCLYFRYNKTIRKCSKSGKVWRYTYSRKNIYLYIIKYSKWIACNKDFDTFHPKLIKQANIFLQSIQELSDNQVKLEIYCEEFGEINLNVEL